MGAKILFLHVLVSEELKIWISFHNQKNNFFGNFRNKSNDMYVLIRNTSSRSQETYDYSCNAIPPSLKPPTRKLF